MKIQTLNKTQEKKLLELCEKFFPNYKSIDLHLRSYETVTFTTHKEQFGYKCSTDIHWYQLCLTELPKKVWNKIKKENIDDVRIYLNIYERELELTDFQSYSINSKEHPLDYLYDVVKECKKNKYFKS